MNIKILSDSTCDLPPELLRRYDITLLPLSIERNGETLRDGIDMTPADVFRQVDEGGPLCRTSAVNVGEFIEHFRYWRASYDAVICVTLSAEMSSCYQNACLAAQEFDQVYAVDSRNLSSAQGIVVLDAARLAESGLPPQAIVDRLNEETGRIQSSFLPDRLDYLYKGGRCSAVAALGANLLHLKPRIEVIDGKMGVTKKYRGSFTHCMEQYARELLERYPRVRRDICFVVHPDAQEDAVKASLRVMRESGRFEQVLEVRTGCTVACHCGPNTIGIMFVSL